MKVQVRALMRAVAAGERRLRRGLNGDFGDAASDAERPGRVGRRPLTSNIAARLVGIAGIVADEAFTVRA